MELSFIPHIHSFSRYYQHCLKTDIQYVFNLLPPSLPPPDSEPSSPARNVTGAP